MGIRLNCNLHSKVGRNYSSSHFNEWNSSNELAYVAAKQFPVSEEAKFCAHGFKNKIFSGFCRSTLKCSFLKMLPLFPTRHWGVLSRGTLRSLLQYGNFVQPLNLFLSRGKTNEAICGHVNRNMQLPWGKGLVGQAKRRRGSSRARGAGAHHEQRGWPPRPEMPPCFSPGSLVPLQGSDVLCIKHSVMLVITGCTSKLLGKEPTSTAPWQHGMLWAAPPCEDPQLVPSLLPCCSFMLCSLQDNFGTLGKVSISLLIRHIRPEYSTQ